MLKSNNKQTDWVISCNNIKLDLEKHKIRYILECTATATRKLCESSDAWHNIYFYAEVRIYADED